jgi:hypothetical protein
MKAAGDAGRFDNLQNLVIVSQAVGAETFPHIGV